MREHAFRNDGDRVLGFFLIFLLLPQLHLLIRGEALEPLHLLHVEKTGELTGCGRFLFGTTIGALDGVDITRHICAAQRWGFRLDLWGNRGFLGRPC